MPIPDVQARGRKKSGYASQRAQAGAGARTKPRRRSQGVPARVGVGAAVRTAPVRSGVGVRQAAPPRVGVGARRRAEQTRSKARRYYRSLGQDQRKSLVKEAARRERKGKRLNVEQRTVLAHHRKVRAGREAAGAQARSTRLLPVVGRAAQVAVDGRLSKGERKLAAKVLVAAMKPRAAVGVGAARRPVVGLGGRGGPAVEAGAGARVGKVGTAERIGPSGSVGLATSQLSKEVRGAGEITKVAGAIRSSRVLRKVSVPAASRLLAAAGADRPAAFLKRVSENALKDTVDIPAQAVPSSYQFGRAIVKGVQGDTKPARALARDLLEHDPAALLAQGKVRKSVEAAVEHPVVALLEARGVKGAAGRGAGAGLRKSPSARARQLGSTRRASRTLPGSGVVEGRRYSRDVINKAAQVALERRRVRRAADAGRRASRLPEGERRDKLNVKAAKGRPRVSDREIKRQVDETVAASEQVRRVGREQARQEANRAVRKAGGKRVAKSPLLSPVAQGIVRADRADVQAYVRELTFEARRLSGSELRANKVLRRELGKGLRDKKLDMGKLRAAARAYEAATRPQQERLVRTGMLGGEQAELARLLPFAARRMRDRFEGAQKGARLRETAAGELKAARRRGDKDAAGAAADLLGRVDRDYPPLSVAEIRKVMRDQGQDEPAFVTQAPSSRGGRNYFVNWYPRQKAAGQTRTGKATARGLFDPDPVTLEEQAVRARGLTDADRAFRRFVTGFAYKKRDGKTTAFKSRAQAEKRARELTVTPDGEAKAGAVEWVPVRLNPWAGRHEALQRLLEDEGPPAKVREGTAAEAIEAAVSGDDGPGPWALVPAPAAKQLHGHMRTLGAGTAGKTWGLINQAFRTTVLATSTKWLAGNILEAELRAAVAGARPVLDTRLYRKTLKRIEDTQGREAAVEFAARVNSGGHYQMVQRQKVVRDAAQFQGTRLAPVAQALGAFWRTPGPKQAAGAWHLWTRFVFDEVNGKHVESRVQARLAGKYIRREILDERTVAVGSKAVAEAARGLKGTHAQLELGRLVDRAYGRYSKFSPEGRQFIALYTPFAAWTLNAARFLFDVLPRDHPVLTGLLASAYATTQEWREKHGLAKFVDEAVPGWLQGSIPVSGDRKLRVSRYTPFSLASDPAETVAGLALPQISGTLAALKGEDWKGNPLRKNGRELNDYERGLRAVTELLKGTVPLLGQSVRVAQGEGPIPGRLRKEFNPFEPIEPSSKKRKGEKKAGSATFDWSSATASGQVDEFDWDSLKITGAP